MTRPAASAQEDVDLSTAITELRSELTTYQNRTRRAVRTGVVSLFILIATVAGVIVFQFDTRGRVRKVERAPCTGLSTSACFAKLVRNAHSRDLRKLQKALEEHPARARRARRPRTARRRRSSTNPPRPLGATGRTRDSPSPPTPTAAKPPRRSPPRRRATPTPAASPAPEPEQPAAAGAPAATASPRPPVDAHLPLPRLCTPLIGVNC